jgi:hypothetical protein
MKTWRVLLLCASLSACAISKETYTPEGKVGHNINCSGIALTWGDCYQKAGELCGAKGYEIIAGGSDSGAIASPTITTSTISRSMLIKCKE